MTPTPLPDLAAPAPVPSHPRLLGADPVTGPPPRLHADALVALLRDAGLGGRGGAGFPAWRKLAAVAAARGRPAVIANAAEGEPASRKDAHLLATRPHLVLDGLAVAAAALRASEAFLLVGRAELVAPLGQLAAERHRRGVDPVAVRVVAAPARFLAGEESAAVNWLAGRSAVPHSKPPLVVQRGLHGRPTLVHNVETLAHVGLIARYGPGWFRRQGTVDEPGTLLLTVSGAVRRPQVLEVAHGTPLLDALDRTGGVTEPLGAVLLGGYSGGWLAAADLPRATLSRSGLADLDGTLGAGVVVALPAASCGVRETARVLHYLARESAGQCGPCLNGLPRLAALLAAVATGDPDPTLLPELRRVAGLVDGRGACRHPDGTVRLLRSALRVFAEEIEHHHRDGCTTPGGPPVLPIPR